MAEYIPVPQLTAEAARAAREVLLEQERALRYPESFGACEALALGCAAIDLMPEYESGYTVTITRERDGVRMFQWVADDKDERNLLFAEGKRQAALAAGHASPWAQLEATISGEAGTIWACVPDEVPACGAFPIRVAGDWVATIAVSGLHDGLDHEVILRALERTLGVRVLRWDAPVA